MPISMQVMQALTGAGKRGIAYSRSVGEKISTDSVFLAHGLGVYKISTGSVAGEPDHLHRNRYDHLTQRNGIYTPETACLFLAESSANISHRFLQRAQRAQRLTAHSAFDRFYEQRRARWSYMTPRAYRRCRN